MSHRNELPDLIHKGITFNVYTMRDEDHEAPWEDGDGRGVVTDWLTIDADSAEAAQLRPLGRDERNRRYFDTAATRAKAVAEEWGLSPNQLAQLEVDCTRPPSKAEITDRAVELEYEFLNSWCLDEWEYIGVIVELPKMPGISASVWGIESNAGEYIQECARELADQCIEEADQQLEGEIAKLQALRKEIDAAVALG